MPASTVSIQLTCSFTAAICCFGLYDFAEARPPTAMLLQPSLCNMPANRPKTSVQTCSDELFTVHSLYSMDYVTSRLPPGKRQIQKSHLLAPAAHSYGWCVLNTAKRAGEIAEVWRASVLCLQSRIRFSGASKCVPTVPDRSVRMHRHTQLRGSHQQSGKPWKLRESLQTQSVRLR